MVYWIYEARLGFSEDDCTLVDTPFTNTIKNVLVGDTPASLRSPATDVF